MQTASDTSLATLRSAARCIFSNRPMVSENYTQCKVPAHGAVTTFQKDQDSRNYSQNSPMHPINKPSKRRLTIVKSQNRRLGDLGQMVPSGMILISGAEKRHIESWRTWGKNAIGQLAHEIAGTAKKIVRTSPDRIRRAATRVFCSLFG